VERACMRDGGADWMTKVQIDTHAQETPHAASAWAATPAASPGVGQRCKSKGLGQPVQLELI